MKVKFSLSFSWGEVNWFNKDHWQKFLPEDIIRCLFDFTEVKAFECSFNEKERYWEVRVSIPPMTTENFTKAFAQALFKHYKRTEANIEISQMKLESKKETDQLRTAIVIKKIEGK